MAARKAKSVTLKSIKEILEMIRDEDPTGEVFEDQMGGAEFLAKMEETAAEADRVFFKEAETNSIGQSPETLFKILIPVTDEEVISYIYDSLWIFVMQEDAPASEIIDVPLLLHLIECHRYNKKSTPENWDFPEDMKEEFISQFDELIAGGYTGEPALTLFRAFTEDLAEEENETALHILGYHSYGGSPAFPCDWERSRECISKLFEENGDPVYANSLGYIAYHGRCSDGVPDYDAAFRYFSYGSANGIIESTYKLADLYAGGKGIWKSEEAAFRLVQELYVDTMKRFCGGELTGKFADVALRMGRLYENGSVEEEPNLSAAYYYYLQARYAIRFRRKLANDYGDDVVERNIENAITRIEPEVPLETKKTCRRSSPWVLQMAIAMDKHVLVTFRKYADESIKLILDRYEEDDSELHDFLVTIPEYRYCAMQETVTMRTGKTADCFIMEENEPILITSVSYDQDEGEWVFLHGNEVAASFKTSSFSMKLNGK